MSQPARKLRLVPRPVETAVETNHKRSAILALLFVATSLFLDAAAFKKWLPEDLGLVIRFHPWNFYVFPFVFWLIIPGFLSRKTLDKSYFGLKNWHLRDFIFAGVFCFGFIGLLPLIHFIPELGEVYKSKSHLSFSDKAWYLLDRFIFTSSWLPGWELTHRFFLLRYITRAFPKYGWLWIPFCEGGYHFLAKPITESLGMVLFSVFATRWTMKRQNLLLPLFVHFMFEFSLYLFLIFV